MAAALDPLLRAQPLRKGVGMAVLDPAADGPLYAAHAEDARVPASTTKLLTAAAALAVLGPRERLRTRVVVGARPGELVLVGGGDPLLTGRARHDVRGTRPASLADLAAATATALRGQGQRRFRLRVDDSLFTGPAVSPDWRPDYVRDGEVAPVSALIADGGRPEAGAPRRAADPALNAGRRFAAELRAAGVSLTGEVMRTRAAADAAQLAAVDSPPLASVVEEALQRSDNDATEALARLVAVRTGKPATFAGAAAAVTAAVERLGVPTPGVRLADGSGLARRNRIAPVTLARLLALATSDRFPALRFLLTGLPVAGFSGTLAERYADPATSAAAGIVHAKTGSLTGVDALAGTLRDADGRLLVFAVLADQVPTGTTTAARTALDRLASALVRCGCS